MLHIHLLQYIVEHILAVDLSPFINCSSLTSCVFILFCCLDFCRSEFTHTFTTTNCIKCRAGQQESGYHMLYVTKYFCYIFYLAFLFRDLADPRSFRASLTAFSNLVYRYRRFGKRSSNSSQLPLQWTANSSRTNRILLSFCCSDK
jgi:hypothetical protein